MNFFSSSVQIETYISSSWTASTYASVPLHYENEPTKPPNNTPWVSVRLLWGVGRKYSRDGNVVTNNVSANIYVPKASGIASASLIADSLRSVFVSASLVDHRFDAPSGPVAVTSEGPWYVKNVTMPFQLDTDNPK